MVDKNCKDPEFKKAFVKDFGKKAFGNYSKGLTPDGKVPGADATGFLLILPVFLAYAAAGFIGILWILWMLGIEKISIG